MVLPVLSPLSLLCSVMALAIGLVVRLMSVSVRRWRETMFVVRWSARTFVRHVAPAAAASLASLSTSAPDFFLARRLSRSRPRPRRLGVSEDSWDTWGVSLSLLLRLLRGGGARVRVGACHCRCCCGGRGGGYARLGARIDGRAGQFHPGRRPAPALASS